MARTRHGRKPGYAMIPNATIDDALKLDFMALALLTVLLRQKDGWEITLERVGKRYGYGRDAMANAMGLLQVARYVVKVRVQDSATAQWSTEIITYDTPPHNGEVEALLNEIADEPGVKDVRVIPPTPAAVKRARARMEKLMKADADDPENPQVGPTAGKPALGEDESDKKGEPECRDTRQSAHPAVSKKTVFEEDSSLPLTPSRGDVPVVVVPSGGASGEEEKEISGEEEIWCDGAEDGPQSPPDGPEGTSGPQESDEAEIVHQRAVQSFAICRGCWGTYNPDGSGAVRRCPGCR